MTARIDLMARALAGLSLLTLVGCADNFARSDRVAFSSGNAAAANREIQTIDPWPRGSFQRATQGDGEKAAQAMRRYRHPDMSPTAGTLSVAPGNGVTTNGMTGNSQ